MPTVYTHELDDTIRTMIGQGHTVPTIADKTGLTVDQVKGRRRSKGYNLIPEPKPEHVLRKENFAADKRKIVNRNPEKDKLLREMTARNETNAAIAAALGIHVSTVRNWQIMLGIPYTPYAPTPAAASPADRAGAETRPPLPPGHPLSWGLISPHRPFKDGAIRPWPAKRAGCDRTHASTRRVRPNELCATRVREHTTGRRMRCCVPGRPA